MSVRSLLVKSIQVTLGLVALAASGNFEVWAQNTDACSNQSAKGTYSLTLTGKAAGYGDVSGVGSAYLIGNGNFSGNTTGTVTVGGVSQVFTTPVNGTYSVNGDCSGTFVINFVNLHVSGQGTVVFSNGGSDSAFLITSPSTAQLTGTGHRQ